MGHLLKRLTYQASSRRISLPFTWLRLHSLEPGAQLWITAQGTTRLIYHAAQWELLLATTRILPTEPALASFLSRGEQASLGSTGRLVLPRALAFDASEDKLIVSWTMSGGILLLMGPDALPSQPAAQEIVPNSAGMCSSELDLPPTLSVEAPQKPPSPEPLLPLLALPDGLRLPSPVRQVKLSEIAGFDPDYEPEEVDPQLEEDIALQGILRPVVLMGSRPLRVVDGQRRLRVAQALKMAEVPALIFNSLTREDLGRMRYLLKTTSDRWNMARQLRSLSKLYLNGASLDQLAELLRKNKRTVQRYLRIAAYPALVTELEEGRLTLQEAEKKLSAREEPSP